MSTGNRYSEEIKEEARELRNQGWSYQQIANKFRVTKSTAHYWCNNKNTGSHDYLIEQLITDPQYDIREDGTILTNVPLSGFPANGKTYPWRRSDRLNDNRYHVQRYKNKLLKVHRIIYRKFKGQLDQNLEINHIDGNKQNNKPDNLELVTHRANIDHAVKTNLHCFGEKHGNAIITEDVAKQIKKMISQGVKSWYIEKTLNVSKYIIKSIKSGEKWKHISI
jgi:transcriptional regulator with XRE-family HTH domain